MLSFKFLAIFKQIVLLGWQNLFKSGTDIVSVVNVVVDVTIVIDIAEVVGVVGVDRPDRTYPKALLGFIFLY